MALDPEKTEFACPSCGRRFPLQQGGRGRGRGERIRCTCGAVLEAPDVADAADPFADDGGAYAMSEPVPAPAPALPPVPVATPEETALAYQGTPHSAQEQDLADAAQHPVRDLYVPAAMLLAGLLIASPNAAYLVSQAGNSSVPSAIVVMLMFAGWVAVKSSLFFGVILVIAKLLDTSFGLWRTVALKLLAAVALTEALRLALYAVVIGQGLPFGRGLGLVFMMTYVVFILLLQFLFTVSLLPFRRALMTVMFVLDIMLILGLMLATHSFPRPTWRGASVQARALTAAPALSPPGAAAPTPAPAPAGALAPSDVRIVAAIAAGLPNGMVWEAKRAPNLPGGSAQEASAGRIRMLAMSFSRMGALNVYVDMQTRPPTLYIELPADPRQRALLIQAIQRIGTGLTGKEPPAPAPNAKFMEMPYTK